MKNLFLSIFEVSISTSFIVIALLLFRPFLNRRYAIKWKYYIWIALALHLVIPINISLPVQWIAIDVPKHITSPVITDGNVVPVGIQTDARVMKITFLDFIAIIWLILCIIFLLINIFSYLHYKAQIDKMGTYVEDSYILCQFLDLKEDLQIKKRIAVMKYDSAESPMIIGFLRPALVIPDNEYSNEEIFFILKHELVHFKRHDTFFKFLFVIANSLHWFNPLIYILQKEAAIDMELSCDERVIQGTSYSIRKKYTETLLSTLHTQHKRTNALTTQFYGGKQIMKKRFKNILSKSKKKNGFFVLVCVVSMTLILGMITGCSLAEENSLGTQINNEVSNNESSQVDFGNNTNSQDIPSQIEESKEPAQDNTPNTEKSLSSDGQKIKRIAEEFITAYFNGDTDSIQSFLSAPFEWDIEVYTGTGTISEISLKGLADIGEIENGSVQVVSIEYRDSDIGDSYRYLTLEFIKQENEWKIQFYGIEG